MITQDLGWKQLTLGEIAIADSGFAFKSSDFLPEGSLENGITVIRMSDLKNGVLQVAGAARVRSDAVRKAEKFALSPHDFLFGMSGSLGNFAVVKKSDLPAFLNQRVGRLRAREGYDQNFINYLYTSDTCQAAIQGVAEGAAQLNISIGNVRNLLVQVPPLVEQQKIATILSAVDEKLNIIARQIETTQALKQGLMQALFSRGVGTQDAGGRWVPHTKFKGSELGDIPETWQVLALNDVVENLDRQRIPLKQADRKKRCGKFPYYGASGIIDWIDGFIFDGDFILLGEDGENVISRKLPLAFRATGKIWVNNHAHVFRVKNGYDIQFLVELLESLDYSTIASGTAQPKITQQALNQLRLAVPPVAEQLRIGAVLVTTADKIKSLRRKQKHYNVLKRGLMQKLLTGEWRTSEAA